MSSLRAPPSAPEVPAALPGTPWRRWLWRLGRLALTVAVLGLVLAQIDLRTAHDHLVDAPRWVFVVPTLLLVCNSALHALRLRVLLAAAGVQVPFLPTVGAMLRASFVGLVLPTGGSEVAKAGFLVRLSGAPEQAVAAVLVGRLLELVPWLTLLLWGLAWGLWAHDPLLGGAATLFSVLFAAILALTLLLARTGGRPLPATLECLLRRLPSRFTQAAGRVRRAFAQVGADRTRLLQAALLALPFSLVNCLVVFVVLRAYGVQVGYSDVLALIPAADTVISLPLTIGGVGVREGVFVRALAPWGATQALALSVALTRWTGELGRAFLGGLLVLIGGGGRSGERHGGTR
ncbi:MAG: flippase-like domain-containing protein [Alphaproteobacteria bacterium]|nr:flippase-like domain-containing protein [Alphaproteobacteria bacterium]